jgi:MFS family permease
VGESGEPVVAHRSRLRIDTSPWRASRQFRLLCGAGTVFYIGQMMTYVAIPFQVRQLTGSDAAVGAIGAMEIVPVVIFGLWGGALADRLDRRRLLVRTGVGQVVLTAVLVLNATRHRPAVWVLFVVAPLAVVLSSLQRPSREALIPRVVSRQQLPAAVALSSLGMQVGSLIGPGIGGLLASTAGVRWAFAVDLVGLATATALFSRLDPHPPQGGGERVSLASIAAGVRYAVGRRELLGTYVIDLTAMTLAFPVALFPALALTVFRRPGALGLLYVAETVGTIGDTLTSGWTSRVRRRGRVVVLAAMAWGAAIALAGIAPSLWLALVCLSMAGAADMISGMFRSSATCWR